MKRRNMLKMAGGFLLLLPAVRAMALQAGSSSEIDDVSAEALANLFDLSVPDMTGQAHTVREYTEKPLVLNFWATWCPPCVKEMPDLEALHQAYPDVNFVGFAADTERNMRKFEEKVKVSYPLLVAGMGSISLMKKLGNKSGGLPFTLIFEAGGKLRYKILGQIKKDELEQILKTLSS
ncbi:TlpA family protein disulfide reductase [Advenella sp. RU8]|uniref:TlpA family protein disulfide reductase n=1 Tax=Advenella sp. RU8 TaxID=3399575 RepID=UPI003AABD3FD